MMKQASVVLIVLLLALVASVALAADVNLSAKISATYPLAGKCAPINGEVAFRLGQQTDAEVYFASQGGFVSGYLVPGETVYAKPDGPCDAQGQWYRITKMVRCGNPARGRFFVPNPVSPAPEVIIFTQVETITEVVHTERCVNLNLNFPAPPPQRQFICPAGVSGIWSPALPVALGSTSVGPWRDLVWLSLFELPDQSCNPETCPPGSPPTPPVPTL